MKLLGRPRKNPPLTPEDWQEAVDVSMFGLELDAMVQYGLIERDNGKGKKPKGSGVKARQCEVFLRQGKRIGIEPKKSSP